MSTTIDQAAVRAEQEQAEQAAHARALATDVAAEQRRLDEAVAAFRAAYQALHDREGRPLYAPHEHERRVTAALGPLRAAIEAAATAGRAAQAAAERELLRRRADGVDPVARLSDAELVRAAALLPFARDLLERAASAGATIDAGDVRLRGLRPEAGAGVAARIAAALERGDRPAAAVWLHLARGAPAEVAALAGVTPAVQARLEALVDPEQAAALARLEALRQAAGVLVSRAGQAERRAWSVSDEEADRLVAERMTRSMF
jgi:hypothetical protein